MEKNKNILTRSIGDIFRNFSISVNITVYSIYLLFLVVCIASNTGVQFINVILAVLTAAFMGAYLFLRLSRKKNKRRVRQVKRCYKNARLAARLVIALTALYSLIVATGSGNPIAIIIALLGVVFVVIRIFVEIFLYFIKKKISEFKENFKARFGETQSDGDSYEDIPETKSERYDRINRERRAKRGYSNEIFISVDDCILSDMDD